MNDFESKIQELEESFGQSTVMHVDEIRLLYHGRLDVYASFTDDGEFEVTPKNEVRPAGYVCYAINDVIGKKVRTKEFYANIFRIKKNRGSRKFIENIRQYNQRDLQDDLLELEHVDYLSKEDIEEAINKTMRSAKVKTMFHKLWEITRHLAQMQGTYWPQYWRKILLDIGYNGFNDPSGSGILIKAKTPVCIMVDLDVEQFDIAPIQKFRRDPRRRVATQVNREVRKMSAKRNRIAKRKFTDRSDTEDNTDYADLWAKIIGGIL